MNWYYKLDEFRGLEGCSQREGFCQFIILAPLGALGSHVELRTKFLCRSLISASSLQPLSLVLDAQKNLNIQIPMRK